ncbi:putative gustatory receptor 2a isoform X1 [Anabrus simplex]|uniref:putative gustatory receptor 2a isoform X1 n=1 Tax=Anabrus simplex TaxID=316456 RepID=UPI0034DDABC5
MVLWFCGSEGQRGIVLHRAYGDDSISVSTSSSLDIQMSRTMELVASIDRTLLDLEVQLELDMFQRQLIANTFVFSAGGFFDINMAQITNIVSSTATYIIILMQFQET